MRGAIKIFKLKERTLYAHWTFLLLIFWILMISSGFGMSWRLLTWITVFMVAVMGCIMLHELGHALVASYFGIRAKDIIILPVGGTASIEKWPESPKQELLISLAGPLTSALLAGLLLLVQQPAAPVWDQLRPLQVIYMYDFLHSLFMANIVLAVFNLIPAFPMDGGRILRALLGFKINYVKATVITNTIGQAIAVVFIVAGIAYLNLALLLTGFFIIVSEDTEEYYLRFKSLVNGIRLRDIQMFDYNSIQLNASVKDAANTLMNNHSKYFIVMNDARPVGTVNRMEIIKAISEKKYEETVENLMKKNLVYFDANREVSTALEQLAAHADHLYPIVENGRFTGVVSFNHLVEYLLIHRADTKEYSRIRTLAGLL